MSVSDVAYEPGLATRPRPGLLSVILPIRASGASDPRIGWLSHVRLDTEIPGGLSVLVVDDGSRRDAAGAIRAACERLGFDYARADEDGDLFSIGRCRNFGARFATSDYVFFQDVDLMPWPGFYARLIQEIGIRNLAGNASRFIMVPVSYLKQGPSADYLSRDPKGLLPAFLHHTLYRDQGVVEKVSTGTSACLYNRMFYLALGGNRSEFSGWGYEDLEFNCRIMRFSPVSRLPSNWCLDQGTFDQQKSFEGWKSLYRLHGDLSLAKGLLLFHRWHPVEAASPYMERAHHNRRIFNQCIRSVEDRGLYPRPLPDHGSGTSWVLRSNTFTLNRFIAPCWGRIVYSEKAAFESDADIRKFLRDANIERVVFHNPYATSDMQRIFACVRRTGIPYFVAERGALGDSFFYDPKGFLADSASYDPGHWNHELQPEQRAAVRHLMKQEQFGLSPLEAQDERLTRELLLRRLGLSGLKPVILVPLQRPGDTATRFFARGDVDYRRYLDEVKRLIALSSDRYDVVVKRHPLEDAGPALGGTDAGSANIFDLLSLCAAVVTFNSGVGCIAQCFMKPVLHFGRAFYSHDGTAMPVTSAEQALHQIDLGWQPCQRTVERFLHYLYFEFYSFGQFQTRQVMTDAGRITATLDILPRVLRLDQRTILAFSATDQQDVTRSMAMDRYPATEPAAAQGGDGAHGRAENLAYRILPHAGSLFHARHCGAARRIAAYEPVLPGIAFGLSGGAREPRPFAVAQADAAPFRQLGVTGGYTTVFSRLAEGDYWSALEFEAGWGDLNGHAKLVLRVVWRASAGVRMGTGLYVPFAPRGELVQWQWAEVTPQASVFSRSFDIPKSGRRQIDWSTGVKFVFEFPRRPMAIEIADLAIGAPR